MASNHILNAAWKLHQLGVLGVLVQLLHLDVGHEPCELLEGRLHLVDDPREILDHPKQLGWQGWLAQESNSN